MPETGPNGQRQRPAQADGERQQEAPAGVLDKLFGKRLLQAGRYVMSHKAWMKTVPTENCDVLMTFPDSTDDHTLLWLLNRMRLGIPELIMQIRQHKNTNVYAFFVTATYENLLRGAEEIGLRKPVKAEFGGGTRSFSCEEDYIYENIENELHFFTSQERQHIIRYWLENLRAKQGETLHNIHFLEGQPIIPELMARGVIHQVFPIHEQRILNRLMKSWVQAICEAQPIDDICGYFGVKIAMYFAWLGFYTSAMVYPAVFGSVLWFLTDSDQTSRDICCVVFALFNVVWASLFLEGWKRRGAELAYKWGTLDTPAESIEEPRPQFRGVKRISPVTNLEEFYYPPWKRRLFQYLVSLPICLSCLSFVFLVMLGCFELQEFVLSVKELPRILRFLPKIILAIFVTTCDELYRKIAYWLNDMENYRLQSAYEKHLIIKIVLFQFVNSYLSLFYIGFYLKDMERLKEMLATLLVMRQFLQNIKEVSQPHLYERFKTWRISTQTLWQLSLSLLKLFTHTYIITTRAGQAQTVPAEPGVAGSLLQIGAPSQNEASVEKKCLNGGCGVPEDEEGERQEEEDEEEEEEEDSIIDCGLKLKRVSFLDRSDRKSIRSTLEEDSFLEEGSPTMVEKGMDPTSMFELCEEEEENGGLSGSPRKEKSEIQEMAVILRHQRRRVGWGDSNEEEERESKKQHRASWIDPPEENYATNLTQAEVESCMNKYEDTFQDYQEMFIQFGYVVLFSSAFPLAAVCALTNNIIEIRSDAFKLCSGLQRPFGQRVESIGQWQNVMEAMGVLAIIVNCYLIGQCGQLQRLFPWLTPEGAIICIVVLEHFALLLKYIIHVVVPDIPAWVAEEMAKLEYLRREAFKKHERQAQHHYQQQQRRKREEEERQRQAEYHARKERESNRSDGKSEAAGHNHTSEKSQVKSKGSHSSEKPKRPSSLLATNNVLKLKQIIPLQSKFLSGGGGTASIAASSKIPQSPTSNDIKLPGFLSFKFLKSPETKRDPEKVQSPTKPFNPGKLFNFGGKSEVSGNGATAISSQPRPGPPLEHTEKTPGKFHLNGVPNDTYAADPSIKYEEEGAVQKH
ncbi:anoctamin-8 isoform X2 [Microcaecilia unicolor]|uniref:Anoctamin n=1 Tax=Microcaecilia unicolor TaxID=1415580 RepID=A0A6P7ZPZ4_9AMPH|nr:anoctamin-8 isoform X2 [Microcaecilia unicolor]